MKIVGGKKRLCDLFGIEMRRFRGNISREVVAEASGVRKSVLCMIEHGKACLVRVEDILQLVATISEIHKIVEAERLKRLHTLIKKIAPPKKQCFRARFHAKQYQVRAR